MPALSAEFLAIDIHDAPGLNYVFGNLAPDNTVILRLAGHLAMKFDMAFPVVPVFFDGLKGWPWRNVRIGMKVCPYMTTIGVLRNVENLFHMISLSAIASRTVQEKSDEIRSSTWSIGTFFCISFSS
jgi:hypothetical protein